MQAQLAAKQAAQAATAAARQRRRPQPVATQPRRRRAANPPPAPAHAAPPLPPAPPHRRPRPAAPPPVPHVAHAAGARSAPAAPSRRGRLAVRHAHELLVGARAVCASHCSRSLASRALRSRRASEFDDSLGRLAVAGAAAADAGHGLAARFESGDSALPCVPCHARPAPHRPSLQFVGRGDRHARAAAVRRGRRRQPRRRRSTSTSDDTISSETAVNLDQGDPLAEADFHMAYGLYDQAADLIRIAISREPDAPRSEAEAPRSVLRLGQQGAVPADRARAGRDAAPRPRRASGKRS